MHYSRNGHSEMKYNWKDLLVDAAIVACCSWSSDTHYWLVFSGLQEVASISQVSLSHLKVSIKEGSEILVAPFESSTQLTELNFHPLFNFDPQKVL